MNKATLDKINDIIESNTISCLTCKYFKINGVYKGSCRNSASHLFLVPATYYQIAAPIMYEDVRYNTRSGECVHWVSEIDGSDNTSKLVKCIQCGQLFPYRDMYDQIASICSKECRSEYNEWYTNKYMQYKDVTLQHKAKYA